MKNKFVVIVIGCLACLTACKSQTNDVSKEQTEKTVDAPQVENIVDAPQVDMRSKRAVPRLFQSEECPKNALKTKDGLCTCHLGGNVKGKRNAFLLGELQPDGSEVAGQSFECTDIYQGGIDCLPPETGAVCTLLEGCVTLDGRVYAALDNVQKSKHYYIPGGIDTTLETSSPLGNCVLDRTDGLPLFGELNDKTVDFACNAPTCPCGNSECKNGELCKNGQCEIEITKPIALDDSNSKFISRLIEQPGPGCAQDRINRALADKCKENEQLCKTDGETIQIRTFDAQSCPNGKRYCHGKGNFPILAPDHPAGYECQAVRYVPGYAADLPLKVWVCTDKNGCDCGDKRCGQNAACIDGTCYCGQALQSDSGQCDAQLTQATCDNGFQPGALGCMCDGMKQTDGYVCALAKDGKNVNYCIADKCSCGNVECPKMTVCQNNACVDRMTLKPLPDDYRIDHGLPRCEKETGCACGQTKCEMDAYCLDQNCYREPYFRNIDGKLLHYRILDIDNRSQNYFSEAEREAVSNRFRDEGHHRIWNLLFADLNARLCTSEQVELHTMPTEMNAKIKGICSDPQNAEMTVGDFLRHCGTGDIPDDVESKYCNLRYDLLENSVWGDSCYNGEMPFVGIGVSGWRL